MKMKKSLNIEGTEKAMFIATIADGLSHPLRIALIHYVLGKNRVRNDVCNKDLVNHFPYSQSSLSQHVKKLLNCGIFQVEYVDRFSYYRVDKEILKKYTKYMEEI